MKYICSPSKNTGGGKPNSAPASKEYIHCQSLKARFIRELPLPLSFPHPTDLESPADHLFTSAAVSLFAICPRPFSLSPPRISLTMASFSPPLPHLLDSLFVASLYFVCLHPCELCAVLVCMLGRIALARDHPTHLTSVGLGS